MTADPWTEHATAGTTTAPPAAGNGSTSQNSTATSTASSPGRGYAPSNTPVNTDDPFATQSEGSAAAGGGGQWDPRIPFEAIEGRMVVMVPKDYRDDADDPFNAGKTREEYRVDLIVLEGPLPLEYQYNHKENKEAEPEQRTMTVTELPHLARGQSIVQGQMIRALKGAEKSGKFLYGVVRRVAQLRDVKAYPTPEKLAEARKQWIADLSAGRPATEPRFTWGLDDRPEVLTRDRISLAAQWWEGEKRRRLDTGQ
jgi:hypothetical protein